MSAEGQAFVEKHSPYSGTTYMIHLRMGMLANETHGYRLFSGDKYLAELCRCSLKTLQRAREKMIDDGFLVMIRPATGQKPAEYEFIFKKVGGHFDQVGGHPDENGWTSEESAPIYVTKNESKESSSSTIKDPRLVEINSEHQRLCELLADLIESNGSKRPTVTKRWVNEMRLLVERDGRTTKQVENMIRWCQQDPFWRSNILSVTKLRAKYDQMRLKAVAESTSSAPVQTREDELAERRAQAMRERALLVEKESQQARQDAVPMPDELRRLKGKRVN